MSKTVLVILIEFDIRLMGVKAFGIIHYLFIQSGADLRISKTPFFIK